LPDVEAVAAATHLVEGPDDDTAKNAARSLVVIARRTPAAVPIDLVRELLEHVDLWRDGIRLALALGDRCRPLVPSVRPHLSAESDAWRVAAAALLLRLTKDAEPSTGTVRDVLERNARPLPPEYAGDDGNGPTWERESFDLIPWDLVAEVLQAAGPDPDDVRRICDVIPRADHDVLFPVLERYGSDAASAVPTLREFIGVSAIRVLGAIGPAARAAIPDIRRYIALHGDPGGVGRAAIARIEAGK
jgi:hypothetical protein